MSKRVKKIQSSFKVSSTDSLIVDCKGKPFDINNYAYDSSSTGRLMNDIDSPDLSPAEAVEVENDILRRRSDAMYRNNSWTSRAVNVHVSNEIGNGITPKSKSSNEEFRTEIDKLWNDHSEDMDSTGVLDVYGMQMLASKARRMHGEVFIRIRNRIKSDGYVVPIQFQMLESVFCPYHINLTLKNGNTVYQGLEISKNTGKVVAYYFYKQDPRSEFFNHELVRVRAHEVIHYFIPDRPGALRAVTELGRGIAKTHLYDKYTVAELIRKETRSHFTGAIVRDEYSQDDYNYDPISGQLIKEDDDGVGMLDIEPGTFPNLLPGEDIRMFDSDKGAEGYADFQYQQLLNIAAAFNCPYELLTGDFSRINDRIARVILNQYHREIEQIQNFITIHQLCKPMWKAFVKRAIATGVISAPDFTSNQKDYLRAEYRTPAWPYIHPLQDIQTSILAKDNNLDSRQNIIATRNRSAEQVDLERKEDILREMELDLITDSEGNTILGSFLEISSDDDNDENDDNGSK